VGDLEVTFHANEFSELGFSRPSDFEAKLRSLGDARVRLLGELDGDGRGGLALVDTHRLTIMGAPVPLAASKGNLPFVFPACGRPPWVIATLERCFDEAHASHAVTVTGVLASDPIVTRENPDLPFALELDQIKVKDATTSLEPAAPYETALVKKGAWVSDARQKEPKMSELHAGDAVSIDGVYELPTPLRGPTNGFACGSAVCQPRLVAKHVTVSAGQ
jgi:hypothetical protein